MKATKDITIRKEIGRQMSGYFITHGYTHKDVAELTGMSVQTIHNQTHGGPIGQKACDAYFRAFGFNSEYLRTGKGFLTKKSSGYQKIKQENEQLLAIVKAQRATIERLRRAA